MLSEVARVLRPGGRVAVHGLVGDRPFPSDPKLPGMASLVQHVPVETEPLEALRRVLLRLVVGHRATKALDRGAEVAADRLQAFRPEDEHYDGQHDQQLSNADST